MFTTSPASLMEKLQAEHPKIFNSVDTPSMVNPHFPDGKPTMFLCGNHASAKKTADMGGVESARAIEPL